MSHRPRALSRPALSIRLRLTLLYSAILALALALFGGALYGVVAAVNRDAAQNALTAYTTSLVAVLSHFRDASFPSLGDTYVQIRSPNGATIFSSSPVTLPFDPSVVTTLQPGDVLQPVVVTASGQQLLLDNASFILHDRVGGDHVVILQVARTLRSIDQPLDRVRRVLLVGGPLVTLLAFGLGWLLAGTALRPIARITRTARAIGESRDFGRRVAYSGPPDEVGRLATTFNAMLVSLQEAYQTQRRFVADASHELRTPLTSIRGNLGLLEREPPISVEDRHAVLADLVSESERLGRLVGDLLTLARTDAGRQLRREPVPLAPLLADLARRLAVSHPGRAIRCEADDAAAVEGDRDAVTQVLLILLDNALKFTPPAGDVSVAASTAGDRVSIAVRDTGPGIAPEALPHVFDRFYQGDAARAGAGTGLGLAIARALVDAMRGTIGVQSELGRGSAFTVTLPRAPATPARLVEPATKP